MNNTVQVASQKYQITKFIALLLLVPTVLGIIVMFTFRSLDTRNYSGHVVEVSGTVISIDWDEDDNSVEIKLSDDVVYNGNPLRTHRPDFNIDTLMGKEVTLVLPERQVGEGSIPTWILGIKQGDEVLIDYRDVIAGGKAEARIAMTISGVIAAIFAIASISLLLWRKKQEATKEESLYKAYCEFGALLQPSCPEYKRVPMITVMYLVLTVLLIGVPLGIVESVTDNVAVQIAVGVSMCAVFVGISAAFIVYAFKLAKKEREFYAENFPFDLDDISHLKTYGKKQKKDKDETQEKLREERRKYPHRYFDVGNGYMVNFTESGVELFEEEEDDVPNSNFVFGEGEENERTHLVCTIAYSKLHLEALPYYRKKDHPLTVIIKSRIEDNSGLPDEMRNDLHIMLDSNLLATLHHFGVEVENLQYILDNKAQLIKENCVRRKKQK